MTKGITRKEPAPRIVYADIIDHPHHQSSTHPHMSLYDRAAQFSSYKALSGFEDMIAEEARLTDRKIKLEDHDLDVLNQKLSADRQLFSSIKASYLLRSLRALFIFVFTEEHNCDELF